METSGHMEFSNYVAVFQFHMQYCNNRYAIIACHQFQYRPTLCGVMGRNLMMLLRFLAYYYPSWVAWLYIHLQSFI